MARLKGEQSTDEGDSPRIQVSLGAGTHDWPPPNDGCISVLRATGTRYHLNPAVGPARNRCLFSTCPGSHGAAYTSGATLCPLSLWRVLTSLLGPCKKPLTSSTWPHIGIPWGAL